MRPLEPGKFYYLANSHYLWASDMKAADEAAGNKEMTKLPYGSMVLFAGFGKFRYLQVVFKDMTGYIWCNTNISQSEHLELVDIENVHEEENEEAVPQKTTKKNGLPLRKLVSRTRFR